MWGSTAIYRVFLRLKRGITTEHHSGALLYVSLRVYISNCSLNSAYYHSLKAPPNELPRSHRIHIRAKRDGVCNDQEPYPDYLGQNLVSFLLCLKPEELVTMNHRLNKITANDLLRPTDDFFCLLPSQLHPFGQISVTEVKSGMREKGVPQLMVQIDFAHRGAEPEFVPLAHCEYSGDPRSTNIHN